MFKKFKIKKEIKQRAEDLRNELQIETQKHKKAINIAQDKILSLKLLVPKYGIGDKMWFVKFDEESKAYKILRGNICQIDYWETGRTYDFEIKKDVIISYVPEESVFESKAEAKSLVKEMNSLGE